MSGDDPTKFSDAQLETGRLLFAGTCTFLKGVTRVPDLPPPDRLEVAFAGRSNVGKSSLLNALTGRKGLARTSNTPGRTQEVNFFSIGSSLHLVDMPGYGYAKASKDKVRAWTELIHDYLRGRVSLRRVFLLIDSRHGPKPSDEAIMQMLDVAAVSYQVILTKSDKISATARTNIVNHTSAMLAKRPAAYPDILLTSANKGTGIAELRTEIAAFLDE